MKSLYSFLSGIAAVVSFGWHRQVKCPFQFPVRSVAADWENIGKDLSAAIKQLESNK